MWCSVATRHTVSAVSWWETALIALLASLAGAFFGASTAALFAARQRRRAARADILTRHLPPLLDRVADAANAVKDTREPQPHDVERLEPGTSGCGAADFGEPTQGVEGTRKASCCLPRLARQGPRTLVVTERRFHRLCPGEVTLAHRGVWNVPRGADQIGSYGRVNVHVHIV